MDVGHVLSNFSHIVENVFKYLSTFDLKSCAQVSSSWKTMAEKEISRREEEYVALFFRVLSHEYIEEMNLNIIERDSLKSDLSDQQRSKAQFCLVFASDYLVNDFDRLFFSSYDTRDLLAEFQRLTKEELGQKRNDSKTVIQTALKHLVPDECKTMLVVAPGVIGCKTDFLPDITEESHGFSGVVFPFIRGLHIFNFSVHPNNCDISKFIPKGIDIKCLLVFAPQHESRLYDNTIRSCLSRQKGRLAVGGVLIPGIEPEGGNIVAFCGESVEAASIAIETTIFGLAGEDSQAYIETEITSKLKKFRETGLLKHECFAFMFASATLGYSYRTKYLLESSIFEKLYPEVPLIGVYGYGEIAYKYLPNIPYQHIDPHKLVNNFVQPFWCNEKYTSYNPTIFVLISLKI